MEISLCSPLRVGAVGAPTGPSAVLLLSRQFWVQVHRAWPWEAVSPTVAVCHIPLTHCPRNIQEALTSRTEAGARKLGSIKRKGGRSGFTGMTSGHGRRRSGMQYKARRKTKKGGLASGRRK